MKKKARYLKPVKPLIIYNKLDHRLGYPSDAELCERFRETNAWKTAMEYGSFKWHDLFSDIVDEVYGEIEKADFDSNSAMGPFFALRQNLIWKMLENEKHTWFASAVSDEYIALRDTACVQAFLSGDPSFISLAAFDALINEAVKQAFGEPVHIFELHPKSRDNFYARHQKTLGRVLVQRASSSMAGNTASTSGSAPWRARNWPDGSRINYPRSCAIDCALHYDQRGNPI